MRHRAEATVACAATAWSCNWKSPCFSGRYIFRCYRKGGDTSRRKWRIVLVYVWEC